MEKNIFYKKYVLLYLNLKFHFLKEKLKDFVHLTVYSLLYFQYQSLVFFLLLD